MATSSPADPEACLLRRLPPVIRNALLTGGVIVLLAVALWFWRTWDPEAFREWKREAGPVPFFLALTFLPAIGFPMTPFYILAGATFSPIVNAVGIGLSLAINVALCYWIANSWLRDWLERFLRRKGHHLPVLEPGNAWRFAFLIKMAPGVPIFVKTYLIGMSGVPFRVHFTVCFGVTACSAAVFALMGESLVAHDVRTLTLSAGVLILLASAVYFIRRRLKRDPDTGVPLETEDDG